MPKMHITLVIYIVTVSEELFGTMQIFGRNMVAGLKEIVLFPFDDHAFPLQSGVQLSLKGYQGGVGRTQIVLAPGETGGPDSVNVAYYGTVKKVGDEFWMWYLGQGPVEDEDADQPWFQRVCLAKSSDGYNWQRPDLGLIEYNGDTHNNLIDLGSDIGHISACVVFHEPEDPDPERRFKMAFADRRYRNHLAVAFSADGLTWLESDRNPVGPWFEMSGGIRLDDAWYLAGQGGKHLKDAARQFATHMSYDFENWTLASSLGFQRSGSSKQKTSGKNDGRQVHLGAGLWNRDNVIIGLYGMWNGHPSNDRRMVNMDLGLIVSHDALHYREPVADFPIVSAAEDSWKPLPHGPDLHKFPALMQGQGFENIGEETLFWYSPWPEQKSDGIRVASWPRDRLGCFNAYIHGPLTNQTADLSHIVSAPVDLQGQSARLELNVDLPNQHCGVSIDILNERLEPLEGYDSQDNQEIGSGFNVPVRWTGRDLIENIEGPIRIRINFTGVRFEDVSLFAAYLRVV